MIIYWLYRVYVWEMFNDDKTIVVIYILMVVTVTALTLFVYHTWTKKNNHVTERGTENPKKIIIPSDDTVINTLETIENENRVQYDTKRSRRNVETSKSLGTVVKSIEPDVLIHVTCEDFEHLAAFVNRADLLSANNNNANTVGGIKPACPKTVDYRTDRELISVSREKFVTYADDVLAKNTMTTARIDQFPNLAHYTACPSRVSEKDYYRHVRSDGYVDFNDDARMMVCRLERLIDSKLFYYANFAQEKKLNYDNPLSYLQIVKAINTLNIRYSDLPYIFTGTFNVADNHALFSKFFDTESFHVCDFRTMPTSLDTVNGNIATDGLVISKALYDRVEYYTIFNPTPGASVNRLAIQADMYVEHDTPGTFKKSTWPLRLLTERLIATEIAEKPSSDHHHHYYKSPSSSDSTVVYETDELMVRMLSHRSAQDDSPRNAAAVVDNRTILGIYPIIPTAPTPVSFLNDENTIVTSKATAAVPSSSSSLIPLPPSYSEVFNQKYNVLEKKRVIGLSDKNLP